MHNYYVYYCCDIIYNLYTLCITLDTCIIIFYTDITFITVTSQTATLCSTLCGSAGVALN